MKLILLFLLTFLISLTFAQEIKKDTLIESNKYYLLFIGYNRNINQLRDEYACSFPVFINIPLDTSYKLNFPMPCSPSMINQSFIFRLSESKEIRIALIDSKDSNYFNINYDKAINGYYFFGIKSKYLSESLISKNIMNQKEVYKIVFSINNKNNVISLPNF